MESKTVTVNGWVYKIGGVYGDRTGRVCILVDYKDKVFGVQYFNELGTKYTASLNKTTHTGTIEEAPLELEDGEWYMCDVWKSSVMIYIDGYFWDSSIRKSESNAMHIDKAKPLYKMVKA